MRNQTSPYHLVIIVAASMSFVACSEPTSTNNAVERHQVQVEASVITGDVNIDASASETIDKRIIITGSTNLPDETEFLISIENETLGFMAQDRAIVKKGKFSSSPLGPISGLIDAIYSIEILMPLAFTQSEQVQRVIGTKGEHLKGPLVEKSEFGGNTVTYKTSHTIGEKSAINKNIAAHRKLVTEVTESARQLLIEGRRMNRLRKTDDLALNRECGQKMRQYQARAKELRAKADPLPHKYIQLGAATIELGMCVSCSDTAMEACGRAENYLNEQE